MSTPTASGNGDYACRGVCRIVPVVSDRHRECSTCIADVERESYKARRRVRGPKFPILPAREKPDRTDGSVQRSVPTASTTYSTCCGRTNRPLDSEVDMSDTAGDTLRSRFARSMLSWSPSRFRLPLLSLPRVLSHSFLRRRAVVSCPNSHSDAAPMSK